MDNHERKIVIIGLVWPEPTSSAAGTRMLQLIKFFADQGWHITFVSPAQTSDYSANLSQMGVTTISVQLNSDTFDTVISEISPTAVLFDRYVIEEQFGWRVARTCPDAVRILDTEDLHCLRSSRTKSFKNGNAFTNADLFKSETAKREIASIYRCDLSLIISEAEIVILTQEFKIDSALLFYLPLFAERQFAQNSPPFEQRSGFMFIGNFLHEPNIDAVNTLKNHIWPIIRKEMPEVTLNVYGAYASARILQLNNARERFHIRGRAEDAITVVSESRILLAPLNFGAGLKGKLLEGMQVGTPSITTTIGAEGINGEMSWPGAIATRYDEFAAAAILLYNDRNQWEEAQNSGYKILESRFYPTLFTDNLILKLERVQLDLQSHRTANFIGAMLMHHTMLSTKYMSMWIQEKNRSK